MSKGSPYESHRDLLSPNRNLFPITSEINLAGNLIVGGCNLLDLADRFGTPLYLLDEETIRTSCMAYKKSLNKYYSGDSLPLYASKANSSTAIDRLIASEGFGLDVVSEGELLTGIKAGIPGQRIFLHGNNKSESELLMAYQNEVNIVIDNQYDIDRLAKIVPKNGNPAQLMLRFTPGIECHTHEYIRTGHLDSKFGFDLDHLHSILIELRNSKWANLNGLHAHIGSQIFELEPHKDLANVMAEVFKMAISIGHQVKDFNVGGGLGIRYVESDNPPSIDNWVRVVSESVSEACESRNLDLPRLICEPGRSLIATAGLTLYRIGSRKKIPGIRTYISVDGGMSDNPRPITYQSLYTACLANRPLSDAKEKVTIAGKHCESGDVLLKDVDLPFAESGEVLVVFGTGAYNYSMSSNYNRIPRPATLLLREGQADLIQKRESNEDLLRYDVLPERLIEVG